MKVKFTITPNEESDEYYEMYKADIVMPDGVAVSVSATDTETSYSEFHSDVYETLFLSLAKAAGIPVEVEEEDWAHFDEESFDTLPDTPFFLDLDDRGEDNGC